MQINGNITGGVSGVAKFDDKVQITCDAGYQFPGGSSVKTTKCGPNFHWQPYLPLCERKYQLVSEITTFRLCFSLTSMVTSHIAMSWESGPAMTKWLTEISIVSV